MVLGSLADGSCLGLDSRVGSWLGTGSGLCFCPPYLGMGQQGSLPSRGTVAVCSGAMPCSPCPQSAEARQPEQGRLSHWLSRKALGHSKQLNVRGLCSDGEHCLIVHLPVLHCLHLLCAQSSRDKRGGGEADIQRLNENKWLPHACSWLSLQQGHQQ